MTAPGRRSDHPACSGSGDPSTRRARSDFAGPDGEFAGADSTACASSAQPSSSSAWWAFDRRDRTPGPLSRRLPHPQVPPGFLPRFRSGLHPWPTRCRTAQPSTRGGDGTAEEAPSRPDKHPGQAPSDHPVELVRKESREAPSAPKATPARRCLSPVRSPSSRIQPGSVGVR